MPQNDVILRYGDKCTRDVKFRLHRKQTFLICVNLPNLRTKKQIPADCE